MTRVPWIRRLGTGQQYADMPEFQEVFAVTACAKGCSEQSKLPPATSNNRLQKKCPSASNTSMWCKQSLGRVVVRDMRDGTPRPLFLLAGGRPEDANDKSHFPRTVKAKVWNVLCLEAELASSERFLRMIANSTRTTP